MLCLQVTGDIWWSSSHRDIVTTARSFLIIVDLPWSAWLLPWCHLTHHWTTTSPATGLGPTLVRSILFFWPNFLPRWSVHMSHRYSCFINTFVLSVRPVLISLMYFMLMELMPSVGPFRDPSKLRSIWEVTLWFVCAPKWPPSRHNLFAMCLEGIHFRHLTTAVQWQSWIALKFHSIIDLPRIYHWISMIFSIFNLPLFCTFFVTKSRWLKVEHLRIAV